MPGPPPLTGIRVLEFAGLAPAPFAGMMLADAGASVLRIDRPTSNPGGPLPAADLLTRHKSSIAVDLKSPQGVALVRALAAHADVLIDPYRPGVLEGLGLGPDDILSSSPSSSSPPSSAQPSNKQEEGQGRRKSLIYARLTGFRRDGRFARMAGHDINYLAVSGALALLGGSSNNSSDPTRPSPPVPPGNLLGDFAGGGAMLVQGIVMALLARELNNNTTTTTTTTTSTTEPSAAAAEGGPRARPVHLVEANMVDGASYLSSFPRFAQHTPVWDQPRGSNLLDGGCPWYAAYETRDGRYMAVGALEPRFFAELVKGLGIAGQGWEDGRRYDRGRWPELRETLERVFRTKTREEWEGVFEGTDACCSPVYEFGEMRGDGDGDGRKEGDQRPAVTLRETPWLAVRRGASEVSHGQGEGVEGEGYVGAALEPGEGGEEKLEEWLGWRRGEQFEVRDGGLVLKKAAKL